MAYYPSPQSTMTRTTIQRRFNSPPSWASGILFLLVCCSHCLYGSGSHVYTDSFPTNDEYDIMVLDPHSRFGSPYGGFSRATSSRLASLPLKLPHVALEVDEYPPHYSEIRDAQGRLYVCKLYHQDELDPDSLVESMFTTPTEVRQDTLENKKKQAEWMSPETLASGTSVSEDAFKELKPHMKRRTKHTEPLSQPAKKVNEEVDDNDDDDDLWDQPGEAIAQEDGETERGLDPRTHKEIAGDMQDAVDDLQDKIQGLLVKKERNQGSVPKAATGKERELTSSDRILHVVAEVNKRLQKLNGMCAQKHEGWWSYEWCHHQNVAQFHIHMDPGATTVAEVQIQDVTKLGKFAERKVVMPEPDASTKPQAYKFAEGEEELARVVDTYMGGDLCPATGRQRETRVTLRCCSPRVMNKIKGSILLNGRPHQTDLVGLLDIVELDKDKVCVYNATVCTPLLCENYGDGEKLTTLKSGFAEVTDKAFVPTAERFAEEHEQREVEAISGAHDLSVREILDLTFGNRKPHICMQSNTGGWWVYEMCHGLHIRQFHEMMVVDKVTGLAKNQVETEYILGKYRAADHEMYPADSEWKHVVNATEDGGLPGSGLPPAKPRRRSKGAYGGNGAYYHQEYTGGDACDDPDVTEATIKAGQVGEGAVERASSVRYSCGPALGMTIKEDSTCHYIVDVSIPALCGHPLFKASVSKQQVVKCLPAPASDEFS